MRNRCTQLMTKLHITSLFSFIAIHVTFVTFFFVDDYSEDNSYPSQLFILWLLGIVTSLSNIFFVADLPLNIWYRAPFIICALLWLFPPLLFTYFGIPCTVGFLILGTVIHFRTLRARLNI